MPKQKHSISKGWFGLGQLRERLSSSTKLVGAKDGYKDHLPSHIPRPSIGLRDEHQLLQVLTMVIPTLRPLVVVSLLCHISWVVLITFSGIVFHQHTLANMIAGILSLMSLHEICGAIFYKFPLLTKIADFFIIFLSSVLYVYRYTTGFFVDYNVIHLNVGLITYGESFSAFPEGTMQSITLGLLFPVLLYALLRHRLGWTEFLLQRGLKWQLCRAVLAAIWLSYIVPGDAPTTDAVTEVFRSMMRSDPLEISEVFPAHLLSLGINITAEYPLMRANEPIPAVHEGKEALPHVIVIALESFSASYMWRNCTECDPALGESVAFCPNVRQFALQNTYSNTYYSNTVQTARSHVAMMCGIIPSWRSKIFSSYPDMNLRCLPEILSEVGYETLYWSSQENLRFDNTGPAMQDLVGFKRLESMNANRASSRSKHWGMGWQDDESYRSFFEYLDEHAAQDSKPWFSLFTAISHHMHFDHVPKSEQRLFNHLNKKTAHHHYEDSIHASDRYFAVFMRELQKRRWLDNAIIIVTADHAYPNGEHQNFYNDFAGYEENFRVPFIIKAPSVSAGRLPSFAGSHVDLAPTILDMLNIRSAHSFFGNPIVGPPATRPTILVQPYAGVYFESVRWPWKLRYDFQTKLHVLINLDVDPMETRNLYGAEELQSIQELLHQDLCIPVITQKLIEANKVFPPTPA